MTSSKATRHPFDLVPDQAPPIGRIALKAKLAEGRRTIVYLGFRSPSSPPVVVREVKKGVDPDTFTLELEYAGALKLGAPLEAVIEQGGKAFAVAPAVLGESLGTILAHAIESKQPVPIGVALAIASRIADQLENIEENGAHGDLVPEHVLVGYDGQVHVIDPAGEAHRERCASASRAGYRSPEHVNDTEISRASDLFSIGIMLYELTTAERLFGDAKDAAKRITSGEIPKPKDVLGEPYPIDLQLIIRKLLRPAAPERFSDAASARDVLSISALAERHAADREIASWMQSTFAERFAAWQSLVGPEQLPSLSTQVSSAFPALDEALSEVARSVQGELALLLEVEEQGETALAPEEDLAKQFLPQPKDVVSSTKPARPTPAPLPPKRTTHAAAAGPTATPSSIPPAAPSRSPRAPAAALSPLGKSQPPMEHGEPAAALPGATAGVTAPISFPKPVTPQREMPLASPSAPTQAPPTPAASRDAKPSSVPDTPAPDVVAAAHVTSTSKPAVTRTVSSSAASSAAAEPPAPARAPAAAPAPAAAVAVAAQGGTGSQQRGMLIAIAILLVLLGLGGLYLYLQPTDQASTKSTSSKAQTRVWVRALPAHASLTVDGREYPHETYVEVGTREIQVTARANGYRTKTVTIRPGQTDNELIVLTKEP
ncbi:MAG: protein kinase [Deltaproteobacteria bacterium]|nr:protein kinase [Deltaproteobacteria bacterium]